MQVRSAWLAQRCSRTTASLSHSLLYFFCLPPRFLCFEWHPPFARASTMVFLPPNQLVDDLNDAPPTCLAIQYAEAVGANGQGFRRPAAQDGVNQLIGGNADGFGVVGYHLHRQHLITLYLQRSVSVGRDAWNLSRCHRIGAAPAARIPERPPPDRPDQAAYRHVVCRPDPARCGLGRVHHRLPARHRPPGQI